MSLTTSVPLSDLRIAALPVVECGEPLVSLTNLHPRIFVDDSPANTSWLEYAPDFRIRAGLAKRLAAAADMLPNYVGFLIKESLRPIELQERYFANRVAKIEKRQPHLSKEQAIVEASKFVAPPDVAGHPTGGAIDLTLCTLERHELNLGCDYDADETRSKGACYSFAQGLAEEVLKNRDLLFSSLERQNIINYPFEWWHWSYGDRYWAFCTKHGFAIYSHQMDNQA